MRVKENVIEDGEMKKQREIKMRNRELEERVVELRGHRPDDRLFRADVDITTQSGVRVNKGQVVRLHKDQDNPHLEMLEVGQEIHCREDGNFIKG